MPEVDAEGGGCTSSDEPMPLRKTVHSCHEWTDNRFGWIHQPADNPFMPCMERQSADSPKHTAEDGSIKVEDNPCNNYVVRASHYDRTIQFIQDQVWLSPLNTLTCAYFYLYKSGSPSSVMKDLGKSTSQPRSHD